MTDIIIFADKTYVSQEVELENIVYIFEYRWYPDQECYFFSLWKKGLDKSEGIVGKRVVQGVDLLKQYKYKELPPGVLVVVDYQDTFEDIKKEDFLGKLQLWYFDSSEVVEV